MAPPKQAESTQTARHSIIQTRAHAQSQEGEQQQPEVVNVDEIASPDTTLVNPTLVVEETQQPTTKGMNVDMPA
jgi:hypothetical protein